MNSDYKIINTNTWKRKEYFDFFSKMHSPYFGIVSEVDCSLAYEFCKKNNISFFSYYLYKSMIAVNSIEELKYRIVDGEIHEFKTIDAGATIVREDETFGFIYVPFSEDFETFNFELQKEIIAVENSSGLRLNNDDIKKNLIRHSTIPWTSFSAILHPTNFTKDESVPKITFGKFSIRDNRKYLPVSVEAHHGLVDGLHLAKYFEEFKKQLDSLS